MNTEVLQRPQVSQEQVNADFAVMMGQAFPEGLEAAPAAATEAQVALDAVKVTVVNHRAGVAGVSAYGPMLLKTSPASESSVVVNAAPQAEDILVQGTAANIGARFDAYMARQASGVDAQIYHSLFDKTDDKKKAA